MCPDVEGGGMMTEEERNRTLLFVAIQVFFLLVSPLAGGFQYKVWSMLDSAILVVSLGLTGLVFVLDKKRARDTVFKAAMVCYILGVLDISLNILLSGWVGWGNP
jgi:nitrate reductase NapE component